jgi:DNA-binding HxlR family transcriptional regulator
MSRRWIPEADQRHKLRLLWSLKDGPSRYSDKRTINQAVAPSVVTPRVLSRELKTLNQFGLVTRKQIRLLVASLTD